VGVDKNYIPLRNNAIGGVRAIVGMTGGSHAVYVYVFIIFIIIVFLY